MLLSLLSFFAFGCLSLLHPLPLLLELYGKANVFADLLISELMPVGDRILPIAVFQVTRSVSYSQHAIDQKRNEFCQSNRYFAGPELAD